MLGDVLVGGPEQELRLPLTGNCQSRRRQIALRIFNAIDDLLDRGHDFVFHVKIQRCGKGFDQIILRAALLAVSIDVQTGRCITG